MSKIIIDNQKIQELLNRGTVEVIERDSLKNKLLSGRQLRIKLGIDPTGAQLHIGHAVPLLKLKQFQDLGHQIILLIGDYTAMVGDPTGRNSTRPILSEEQIQQNMTSYVEQASKILDITKTEIRHNSEWYGGVNFTGLLMDMTSKITVARVLERDDFQKRLKEGSDIQMQEILYPLLQGYDSVALKADVEIGGNDQKFNILMGRKMQKRYNQQEQDMVTVPLLEGTDGERKMSKSYDNYIAINDTPEDMFGKIMAIPDSLIIRYFELATTVSLDKLEQIKNDLQKGLNPRNIKMLLGFELVRMYHSEMAANKSQEYFISTFSKKENPDEMPEIKPSVYEISILLVEAKVCKSKSEARQVIDQGGVSVNDNKIEKGDYNARIKSGDIIKKGSRWFVKVK